LQTLERVPVMNGLRCIELADPSRARRLAKHANVQTIRRRKDRKIVELQVHNQGDEGGLPAHFGNPLAYSYREEVDGHAPIWQLKYLPKHTRNVFRAVVLDCAA
jgi:hypothetical protein